MAGKFCTKASSSLDNRISATRRKLSCVLRSASVLADAAPTPKTSPAVVGAVIRLSNSSMRSLSFLDISDIIGNQYGWIRCIGIAKNLGSLNASDISLFQFLDACGNLPKRINRERNSSVILLGNALALSV